MEPKVLRVSVAHYRPHQWQRWFHACPARDRALIAGIRGGKTVAGSYEALRLATEGQPGVGMVTGPDLKTIKQATLQTILHGMGPARLGKWPEELIADFHQTDMKLTLIDGNTVLFRGADNPDDLRGLAAKWWWADELSLCKPETLPVLQGRTLDTGGRGIATMTPKGKNWLWHAIMADAVEVVPNRVWKRGRWEIIKYPSRENPGLPADGITELAEDYTDKMREQELEAEFVDWGGAAFTKEDIDRCVGLGSPHWRTPREGHTTQIGLDPAGKGRDFTVFIVVCRTCRGVVDFWRARKIPYETTHQQAERLVAFWKPALVTIDDNGLGDPIFEEIAHRMRQAKSVAVEPFIFSQKSKGALLMELGHHLETGIGLPLSEETAPLVGELRGYEWDDAKLLTDCVMALALAVKGMPLTSVVRDSQPQFANLAAEAYRPMDWARETSL